MPERPAQYESIPRFLFTSPVGDFIKSFCESSGAPQSALWSHQSKSLEILGRGDNLVVSTGTASGKSLIFRALAFHKLLLNRSSRILVFYPLRALVADQLHGWREMASSLGLPPNIVGQIDGSIPPPKRDPVLRQGRIIVMTPDVCQAWMMSRLAMPAVRAFVRNLSVLVMDEAHTLEGIFGSNFAFLIRRILAARNQLLSKSENTRPLQLIAATATISNPSEHIERLTGSTFATIDDDTDGSAHFERIVAHVACPDGEELQIAKDLQQRVVSGRDGSFITFMDSRKGVETLAMATQNDLDSFLGDPQVASYRGGFTSEERRDIENKLRSGQYRGVVSTSALELGIDFPNLRVGFNIGLPSTRKAYRQRLGRVGRSGPGAFVLVGPPDMFSRYGTSLSRYHRMSVEPSFLYLDNRFMQFAHARCLTDEREALAAPATIPSHVRWPRGFRHVFSAAGPGSSRPPEFDAIAELGGDTPQRGYPLRNIGENNFEIKMGDNAPSMGEATHSQALRECYPGATYLHGMRSYEVSAWHASTFRPFIKVRNTSPGRSTRPQITTWINTAITASELIDNHLMKSDDGFLAESEMLITERVDGYFDQRTDTFCSYQELRQRNPNMRSRSRNFRTTGVVLCIGKDWFKSQGVRRSFSDLLRDIFAHEYSVLPQDIGSTTTNISVQESDGRSQRSSCIAVFDSTYGSLRLTERLYLEFEHILERVRLATDSGEDSEGMGSVVDQVVHEYSRFSPVSSLPSDSTHTPTTGHELVFAPGSRVCHREAGAIATDVEIIQPTMMNGELRYQISSPSVPGRPPMKHWVLAARVEPSADADAWEYVWWNRETETYEDPPGEPESAN